MHSLGWRIEVFTHHRNALFRILCEHLVSGIGDYSQFCFVKELHLTFLPINPNHRLAFTDDKQNPVGKSFDAFDQTNVEIPIGIDSLLKKTIRCPRTESPGTSFFRTTAVTAIACLRMFI